MHIRRKTVTAAVCTAAFLCMTTAIAVVTTATAGAAATSGRMTLAGSEVAAAAREHPVGVVAKSSQVNFDLVLQLRDAKGAQALVKAVSSPGSAEYRHYVTAAKWESEFSPTNKEVAAARNWLRSEGFKVGAVSKDRITIAASGSAAQVERAFDTNLGQYKVDGQTIRLATKQLSVPTSVAGSVEGAMGINQSLATPAAVSNEVAATSSNTAPSGTGFPRAPAAFITAKPCGSYYGEKSTKTDPAFGKGYPATIPDEVCGYKPGQFRSAYGITSATTGAGVTVAVIDAYGSSTIDSDATQYFAANDPTNPFSNANFTEENTMPFNDKGECAASGWSTEQAIDVESVHSTAPDANILYVGAQNCLDTGLFAAEQTVIDNAQANVVTNSWADTGGDLLTDASTKTAYDDIFMMADTSGITIQFSSGDDGDNFPIIGLSSANYPSESPYVTAVGGTSLQIGANGQQTGQLGWATGRSFECTANIEGDLPGCSAATVNTWLPVSFDGASGGYTSYNYTQPWYQASVVPSSLSTRNEDIDGPSPMRVIPDISLDADPATGFLIGLTETFPNGTVKYGQTRYGGTSLASPLLAGVIADADQASIAAGGAAVGFINPAIYRLDSTTGAIEDIVSGGLQAEYRVDHAFTYIPGDTGFIDSFRELTYTGKETYCDGTGNCETRHITQTVAPGYDSLTGLGSIGPDFVADLSAF